MLSRRFSVKKVKQKCKEVSSHLVAKTAQCFNRSTKACHLLCAVAAVGVSIVSGQSSDIPGASAFHTITRPANSFIIGALHIDNDEFAIPLGPVEWNADHLGKSMTVTGPIDMLAYAGPKTASSLTTYTGLTSQLTAAGYTEVWSSSRKTCGSPYHLAVIVDTPLIDATHQGDWGIWLNDDLNATNGDLRYGTFRQWASKGFCFIHSNRIKLQQKAIPRRRAPGSSKPS